MHLLFQVMIIFHKKYFVHYKKCPIYTLTVYHTFLCLLQVYLQYLMCILLLWVMSFDFLVQICLHFLWLLLRKFGDWTWIILMLHCLAKINRRHYALFKSFFSGIKFLVIVEPSDQPNPHSHFAMEILIVHLEK